jgi:hypothetical protein
MRRRSSLFFSLVLVLGTVLSGLAISGADTTGATGTTIDAPGADTPVQDAAPPDTAVGKRRLEPGKVDSWRDLCVGPKSIRLTESSLCTHGSDRAPREFANNQPVAPLSPSVARQEAAAIPCAGDGTSGYRVEVLYVRGSNITSRYTRMLASIQGWAGAANQIFQQSAAATGGSRSLRFVHDSSCVPIVRDVVVSPSGDGNFGTMLNELRSQGYDRTDRIYLTFVDTTDAGICGIGTLWSDDRASADNWNNFGPSYARVDAQCWSGEVAAHELMHNLGGVQYSAPNSSGGFHCIDEYDVMCYRDSAQSPSLRYDCPDRDEESQLDCGHQDYYHTNPDAGSYLASFWNPANNQFLIGTSVSPPPPTDDETETKHKKKGKKGKKGKKHHRRHHRH